MATDFSNIVIQTVLPSEGLCRLPQIIGRKPSRRVPGESGVFPMSKSKWWDGVSTGKFPQPARKDSNATYWNVSDIRALFLKEDQSAA